MDGGLYFILQVIAKKTVKYAFFAFARISRRDARAVSCESRIYFYTTRSFPTPPSSLRFVQYHVRVMHDNHATRM